MKNNKITVWTLIPNQYERTIYLVLSSESFYDVMKLLNEKYNFNWKEGTDFTNNDSISAPVTVVSEDAFKIAIILKEFNNKYTDYSILAHEIYHAMTQIAESTGAEMNDNASEHWAYFLSFYMDCCAECLLEHIKTLKNKKHKDKSNK